MSTIGTNSEDLILNADGSGSDIKFKSNGSEVASISDGGVVTATSFAGSGANLTGVGVAGISSSADATAMTITSAERVGINKTSPDARLDISAASETGLRVVATVSGEYPAIFQSASTNSTPIADFRSNGGTTRLQVTSDGRGISQFTAHAWANINQQGSQAIRDSHNVSSISDEGTGLTKVNYSNNIGNSSTDACVVAMGKAGGIIYHQAESASYWQGEIRNDSGSAEDTATLTVLSFGD